MMSVGLRRLSTRIFRQHRQNVHLQSSSNSELERSYDRQLLKAVCPLHALPYERQLELKYLRSNSLLQNLGERLAWLEVEHGSYATLDHMIKHGGICPVEQTKASPVIDGYRNKSEFNVGRGPDGNPKTVGFFVGDWRKKNVVCVPAAPSRNDIEEHKQVAEVYQDLIRQSPLPAMQDFQDGGHWRPIMVRSNRKGHLMAIVTFHPQGMSESEVADVKTCIRDHFVSNKIIQIDSLYFQESTKTRTANEESPFQLLHGQPFIHETLFHLNFRISPSSFFQVNTSAAEVLYSTVRDLSGADCSTTLIDVCCGTGTIGLVMSPFVKEVIGIEIVQQAVADAQLNASSNGITNSSFLCGAAERVLPGLAADLDEDANVVMVANPSRAGLHSKVIRAIRNCAAIRRLVYVSCKPDGTAFDNFINLCKPTDAKLSGRPFIPVRAVPVDMFPHTQHCELVIEFERCSRDDT